MSMRTPGPTRNQVILFSLAGALAASPAANAQACPAGGMFDGNFVRTGGSEGVSYVFPDRSLTTADLNNDGFPDLVGTLDHRLVGPDGGRLAVLLGNGDGTFTEMPRLESIGHPVDFDNDGILDIVGPGPGIHSEPWRFYKGNGDGTFLAPADLTISHTGIQETGSVVRILDFDGDGNPDLVEAYPDGTSRLVFHWGNADGTTFGSHTDITLADRPGQLFIADLDNDGKPEIIANSERAGGNAIVVWNDSTRTPTIGFVGNGIRLAVADFDANGLLDIARTGETFGGAEQFTNISYNEGNRAFTSVNYSDHFYWFYFAAADFDQDGDPDLAAANLNNSQSDVEIARSLGNRSFTIDPSYSPDLRSHECLAADVNADGMPDLIYTTRWGNPTTRDFSISVALNQCAPPAPCPADLAPPAGILDLADISAFVAGFTSADPIADLAPDGVFDLADIAAFVTSFNTGCP